MKKAKSRSSQVAFSWGILLGMLLLPVLALMAKVFPQHETIWEVLMAVAGLVIIRSAVGYLFPAGANKSDSADKHTEAATQSH